MDIRIYYEDTDCGGVVYYANYLRYFERARTEFLRGAGVDIAGLMAEGFLFTVAEADVKYHAPAVYDDVVRVSTRVAEVAKVRFYLTHEIVRAADGRLLVSGGTWMACVRQGRPARLPDAVTAALSRVLA